MLAILEKWRQQTYAALRPGLQARYVEFPCGILDRSQLSPVVLHSEGFFLFSPLHTLQTLTTEHEQALGCEVTLCWEHSDLHSIDVRLFTAGKTR
jgi:hypothetical protein